MDSIARRYRWHDFRRPGWYHITLSAARRGCSVFAVLSGSRVEPTALGALAERLWRERCAASGGALVTHSFQLMPDHIHFLLQVAKPLVDPLGSEIGAYKGAVTGAARRELGLVPGAALWEPGFDWRIKTTPEDVAGARLYVGRNPDAAEKKRNARSQWGAPAPLVHRRLPAAWPGAPAGDSSPVWHGFGNPALLDAERRVPVRVSRRISETELAALEAGLCEDARRGAVLVSPAISPGEQRIVAAALRAGGRVIRLEPRPLGVFSSPGAKRLPALAEGRLLLLSPFPADAPQPRASKALFESLNALALAVCRAE